MFQPFMVNAEIMRVEMLEFEVLCKSGGLLMALSHAETRNFAVTRRSKQRNLNFEAVWV